MRRDATVAHAVTDAVLDAEDAAGDPIAGRTTRDIAVPLKRVSANLVRDYARAVLVPEALLRLHEIGMGKTTFATPVATGAVLQLEAPPAVQANALKAVIAVGVPPQVGLVGDAEPLPGVIAVGEYELQEARDEAHTGVRSATLPRAGGIEVSDAIERAPRGGAVKAEPDDVPPAYVPPEGHDVVEVVEGGAALGESEPAPHVPVTDPKRALAAMFLAKLRANPKRGV